MVRRFTWRYLGSVEALLSWNKSAFNFVFTAIQQTNPVAKKHISIKPNDVISILRLLSSISISSDNNKGKECCVALINWWFDFGYREPTFDNKGMAKISAAKTSIRLL